MTGPEVSIETKDVISILYLLTCRPVNLSTSPSALTYQKINRGVPGIMGKPYLSLMIEMFYFSSGPVNRARQVDSSTCKHIHIRRSTPIFTSGPVNPGGQVVRLRGR